MNILVILTIISFILCMVLVNEEQKFRRNIFSRKIQNHNKIRFTLLVKEYLKNTNEEDIKDLITCLFLELKERKNKK